MRSRQRGRKRLWVLVATLAMSGPVWSVEGETSELTVEIVGLESARGQVRIAVFDSEADWLKNAAHAVIVDLESRDCSWTFENVRPGEFGIVVLHDLNANGKNDRNLIGIPKEPYGFSNGMRATFGPPRWPKAKFDVSVGDNTVQIRVK